ncbi:MAG: AAA family ATPase [Spirochaetaceae bacterium]|jgi:flagellar biosynthesis protein FlhG|nr:AAA family ATPase [Spirochaetaceae bacterium]
MRIIPVASGKGGVGKSLLSANLSIALGQAGKKVTLVDSDLGASNLHLVLGHQAPKKGLGTFLTGASSFEDTIAKTDYENVSFIPGDSEIPGITSIKTNQKRLLINKLIQSEADYVILDLGAGTHLNILDFFLLSPRGIIITAPSVTATLNAYLFLKNAVFRFMSTSFKQDSPAYAYLQKLKNDTSSLQRMYIPRLIEAIQGIDPESAEVFVGRMNRFHPRLIMNMVEDPKDADKAQKIRRSCKEYLGIDMEHLGIMYRDSMQDIALSSRLPVIIYKPQSLLSQGIYRIADKIIQSEDQPVESIEDVAEESFHTAEMEASLDYETRISYVEDLIGSGALTMGDLAETIKTQQYEITQLRKENQLLRSKLVKAASMGFKL